MIAFVHLKKIYNNIYVYIYSIYIYIYVYIYIYSFMLVMYVRKKGLSDLLQSELAIP